MKNTLKLKTRIPPSKYDPSRQGEATIGVPLLEAMHS